MSNERQFITLGTLAGLVKATVERLDRDFWVVAELAQVNVNRKSGHCYLELVERSEETLVASMKAAIWAGVFKKIATTFREATGAELKQGMKVLLQGRVTYHEVYGLSLSVRDIDPQYTLGEMAMKRRETLDRLAKEGLIDLNRRLPMPLVPQRLAVIASETSAGYGDFMERIRGNHYGYGFKVTLVPALMQGEKAEASIIAALRAIQPMAAEFDVVVMIRGGGSQVDLSCFDSYNLASAVARMPLPVLTGIGHERDESVVDRVAHRRLITPSAVAEFIVSCLRAFDEAVEGLMQRVVSNAETMLAEGRELIAELSGRFRYAAANSVSTLEAGLQRYSSDIRRLAALAVGRAYSSIANMSVRLGPAASYRIKREPVAIGELVNRMERASVGVMMSQSKQIDRLAGHVRLLDPMNVLKRGYSITMHEGRSLTDPAALHEGQEIETVLYKGKIKSTVKEIKEGI